MDRRNQPVEFWGQSITYWCRLWQSQLEYSMRFWGAMAERMPHPSAKQLAAEAEAMREICEKREMSQRKPAPAKSAHSSEKPAMRQVH